MSVSLSALSQARRDAGLTLNELERRTGVPTSRLSVLLREKDAPDARLSTVETLADALDQEIFVIPKALAPFVRQMLESQGSLREVRQTPSALERSLGPLDAQALSGLREWAQGASDDAPDQSGVGQKPRAKAPAAPARGEGASR